MLSIFNRIFEKLVYKRLIKFVNEHNIFYYILLYKHQWNTRWVFARKHDLHTCTCYFHTWEYHRCYAYIINRAFRRIKLFQWNGLVFHSCLYNKQNITWPLGHTKFLFSCWKYFSTLEEKFRISSRPCNILYLLYRQECFTGKYTSRKIHKNYIRDTSGLFSIVSLVSLSMT